MASRRRPSAQALGRAAPPGGSPLARPLTMKQIGQLVGVSQSTVSRVLSGTTSGVPVAAETRERILSLVAELGYTPNPMARALRGARTALLGLIVRDIEDPFFAMAIAAITAEARRHHYNVVLGHAGRSGHQAVELREVLQTGHCDGSILLGDLRDQSTLWADLTRHPMPLVGLWQGARAPQIPVVNVDNRKGASLALEHLVELGHTRIAFIQGGRTGDGLERREAYLEFVREHDLSVPERYVRVAANSFAGGASAMRELAALREPPTAVLASTDVVAVGALSAASQLGLHVPSDLSVMGFDDIPLTAFTVPALTTVHQPIAQIARLAVEMLLQSLDGSPPTRARRHLVEPSLVVRNSCAAPPSHWGRHWHTPWTPSSSPWAASSRAGCLPAVRTGNGPCGEDRVRDDDRLLDLGQRVRRPGAWLLLRKWAWRSFSSATAPVSATKSARQ